MSIEDDSKFNKSFCITPWISVYSWPSGEVYPCCMFTHETPLGNLKSNTFKEILNNSAMKDLRQTLLSGDKPDGCRRCYELETAGVHSMRVDMNDRYSYKTDEFFEKSEIKRTDVELEDIRLIDIRFSNICNFKCRTCGPSFSNLWAKDLAAMYESSYDPSAALIRPKDDIKSTWAQLKPILPFVEEVYFAGGEPLLMEEHYWILEELIRLKRTSVKIRYNTNLSVTRFKDWNIFELWRHFDKIKVGASLDAYGKRAEYIRHGTKWETIVQNRRQMQKEVPHPHFYVSTTVSIFNILHILDFHKYLVESEFIEAKEFFTHPLQEPRYYRAQILPTDLKQQVKSQIYEHFQNFIEPKTKGDMGSSVSLLSVADFLEAQQIDEERANLLWHIDKLDKIRKESFVDVFPELSDFYHSLKELPVLNQVP